MERIRRSGTDDVRSSGEDPSGPPSIERASPGLAALFERLHDDGRHSILDFGSAGNRQLRLLGRFARRIRFAGLLPGAPGVRRSPTHSTACRPCRIIRTTWYWHGTSSTVSTRRTARR